MHMNESDKIYEDVDDMIFETEEYHPSER